MVNLKARNSYKNLITNLEKILENRVFKCKFQGFSELKIFALKQTRVGTSGSDKLQQAQQQIMNKEKELELDWVKSTSNSINVVKETLINNQEVFNHLYIDDNIFSGISQQDFYDRLSAVFKNAD